MKMKPFLVFAICVFSTASLFSQIEDPNNTVRFESSENNFEDPTGLELPAIKTPNLTKPNEPDKYSDPGEEQPEPLDITKGDGLLEYKSGKAPKYFTKDKAVTKDIGGNQYLGDFTTSSGMVNVQYRDHEYVDGDQIRVFVNEDIVQSRITLGGGFRGFKLPLQSGINRVEFLALNQGSSGPNTAELHVYDDEGKLVSAYEWNLLTGDKATVIIVKE